MKYTIKIIANLSLLSVLSATALAHTEGAANASFASGFAHPFSGWDHWLSFLALGVLAWRVGRGESQGLSKTSVQMAAVPAAVFLAALCTGFVAASLLPQVSHAEFAVAAGVVVLGFVLALVAQPRLLLGVCVAAALGIAHGYVHGVELAGSVKAAMGMVAASVVVLLSSGVLMGLIERAKPASTRWVASIAGAGLAALGIYAMAQP